MLTSASKQYGDASWTEKMSAIGSLLFYMPLVLIWTLLTAPFNPNNAHKSWGRVLGEKLFYYLPGRLSVVQMQWLTGDTHYVYMDWAKKNGLPALTDDLGGNTRLLWIGRPRTDRVILYFHGGAFMFPMNDFGAKFWKRTLTELRDRGADTGLAILNYSLLPTATFPTPLKQAVLALEHLISTGVRPENIQIAGDSAGGNLALQLISHILHPLDGVPRVKLSAPIRGVYLMSPWVSLSGHGGSLVSNEGSDVASAKCLAVWGRQVLEGIPDSQRPYIEVVRAPKQWFSNAKNVVGRVLITAGEVELMRDEIVVFADRFCRDHDKAQFIMQKHGVHIGPFFEFFTKEAEVGEMTLDIWDWLADGFKQS